MVTEGERSASDADSAAGTPDFYVSYAGTEQDQAWAVWIAWELEAAGYEVMVQAWDFRAGSHFVHEMHRAAATARRTVAVLSAAYLTSAFAEAEWQAAWVADPSGSEGRLVVVRVEDCPLPGLLGQQVGVDLFGLGPDDARGRLLAAVAGGRAKPDQPPGFPGRAARGGSTPRFPSPLPVREVSGWDASRSPFPGLAAFDAARAGVFAGREQETRHLAGRLVGPAGDAAGLMVVVGPSGCGKSSLVAAGLAPRLAADPDWLVLPPVTPGSRPVAALAAVLAATARRHGLDWDPPTLAGRLADPDTAGEVLSELLAAAGPARRMLLTVDQAEELLVRAGSAEQTGFLSLLAAATHGPVRAVATLRSEYLDRLVEAAAPAGLAVRAEVLAPLARDLLPVVITGPARLAGLVVDDELVARMVADTGDGQGLPLLAYTLQRLYLAASEADTTVLSPGLYRQVGGVRGALVEHAAAALAQATTTTGHRVDDVLATLLRLVTVDTDEQPVRRRVPLDQLPDAVRGELVPFVDRRLLVVDAVPGGSVTVEVAHERLLSGWPPLARAIANGTDRLRQRAQVETATRDWEHAGRPDGQLWGYSRADSALAALGSDDLILTARLFLAISRRRARRRLTTVFTVLTVLSLAATSLGIIAYLQSRAADEQRQAAEDRRRAAVADRLLTLADNTRDTDPAAALRFAVAAHMIAPEEQRARVRGDLLQTLAATPYLRTTLTGDTGDTDHVYTVAFGPGGLLASGAADGTVRLWDTSDPAAAGPLGGPLTGHARSVQALAFGPGGLLASGGDDGTVRLWDVSTPAAPRAIGAPLSGHAGTVSTVAFGPGGLLASGGFDQAIRLWDVSDPAAPRPVGGPLDHTGQIYAVAFGPGGLLAGGGQDRTIRLWDVSDPAAPRPAGVPITGHAGEVRAVAFGPGGALASGGDDTVRLWDVSDPTAPHPLGEPMDHPCQVGEVAFGPGGLLASGCASFPADGRVRLWDVSDPGAPRPVGDPLTGHTGWVAALAFGPGGLLASGGNDGTVRLWDTAHPGVPRAVGDPLTGHTGWVSGLAFGPDGLLAAGGGSGGTMRLWDVSTPAAPRLLGDPRIDWVTKVAFGPGGLLASGAGDGTVRLWDTRDPAEFHPFAVPLDHTSQVSALAFAPGGLLASGGLDRSVRLWDVSDPAAPRAVGDPLVGHTHEVAAVAFGPGGLLASGGDDTVRLWDVSDPAAPHPVGGPLDHTSQVSAVAFGPGGLLASGGHDGRVRLWNVSDPAAARLVGDPINSHSDYVSAVAFGPDGLLASGGDDGTVRLWDVSTPAAPRPVGGPLDHASQVTALAFGPDGLLASGGADGAARLWDVRVLQDLRVDAVRVACQRAGRDLDEREWSRYLGDEPYGHTCHDRSPS